MSLIELNPYFRQSALECLKDPIFDKIRIQACEQSAAEKLKLDIDRDEAFDYDSGKSKIYTHKDYLSMIDTEVSYFNEIWRS